MHIALITAGGAGMFCGSCMHDNTLARALLELGCEVSLIPTYTPIRVDEPNVSQRQVLLGGINIALDVRWPLWQRLPRGFTHWFDAPWLINLATRLGVSPDAAKLGQLTIATLEGDAGPERNEVDEFARFVRDLRPDVVCYSNALLVGTLRRLRRDFPGPVYCLLQGDDLFLESLVEPYQSQARELLRAQAGGFTGFLVHSEYYREFMADYLQISPNRFRVVPLGIDVAGHDGQPREQPRDPATVGYFARICPEKGVQQLLAAFRILHQRRPQTQLRVGGYLAARDAAWFKGVLRDAADLGPAFRYIGSPPDHAAKVQFLKSLDLFSVPTVYREPKGLYVLEALANGVPVVQPRHGAFPELIAATQGGVLVNPQDPPDLARGLEELLDNPTRRFELARSGHRNVFALYDQRTMARATLAALHS